jgi:hypothetical protein
VLHLQSTNPAVRATAIATLEELSTDAAHRPDALRNLTGAALKQKDFSRAQLYSRRLVTEDPPPFGDRLLRLLVLKESASAEFAPYLAGLENLAATNQQNLSLLGSWLRAHEMSDETLNWLLGLPEKTRTERTASELIAECHGARGEWAKVQAQLEAQHWADLDFIRLALLAHARRELNQKFSAQADWQSAVAAASGNLKALSALLDLAGAWNWSQEREDVAWRIIREFPAERPVLGLLEKIYFATTNTVGLQKVYAALMNYDSPDLVTKNNFAALSLLLHKQLDEAFAIARDNFKLRPGDPVIASTYAYSLHLQNRTQDGLNVLNAFKDEQLRQPAVAAYYGVLLTAAGQTNKSRGYLEIAGQSSTLLPEEKNLVAAARAALKAN